MEYAVDVAQACSEVGVKAVAVTAGYIRPEPRVEFYRHMDAANVDLQGFTEDFYRRICAGRLQPVLETLEYLKHETRVWFEITNLLIPGANDTDAEIDAMTGWVVEHLGPDVPMHFTAFHPRLEDARPSPDPAGHPDQGSQDSHREWGPPRLHRQRPRRGGRQHLVPCLWPAADRAGLVPAGCLESDRGWMLPPLWHSLRGAVRGAAGGLGPPPAALGPSPTPPAALGPRGIVL
jgi:hypothetical protein